jgi:hypothetical protein
MDTASIERHVEQQLGIKVKLTHKGNHRFASERIECDAANSGVFAALFAAMGR